MLEIQRNFPDDSRQFSTNRVIKDQEAYRMIKTPERKIQPEENRKTLETNIDEFILSLETIAHNVNTDGTVRRSSLRLSLNPFDYALDITPEELQKSKNRDKFEQIQQTPQNSPLKKNRCHSQEKLFGNYINSSGIQKEFLNSDSNFSIIVQEARQNNHQVFDEQIQRRGTISAQLRKKLVLPKESINFCKKLDSAEKSQQLQQSTQSQNASNINIRENPDIFQSRNDSKLQTSQLNKQPFQARNSNQLTVNTLLGIRQAYLPLTPRSALQKSDIKVPKIVKACIQDLDLSSVQQQQSQVKKAKSLERSQNIINQSGSKQEINHRLIPCDLLLDAKPNIKYNQQIKKSQILESNFKSHKAMSNDRQSFPLSDDGESKQRQSLTRGSTEYKIRRNQLAKNRSHANITTNAGIGTSPSQEFINTRDSQPKDNRISALKDKLYQANQGHRDQEVSRQKMKQEFLSMDQSRRFNESKKEADVMIDTLLAPQAQLILKKKITSTSSHSSKRDKIKKINGYSFQKDIHQIEDAQ
ncbi:UNKNOWN [Stylonychia lemnae]|uniref:Uncharacterized protein n=1 Tax=Stylonychia lemnae TaxID=5949 RepID=A0A078AEQ7_STYLE|nr:UNKNOWN [Stylonychia lemnae]|eukprot:CDW80326.1 UNKNOWN [Stylonychia lemnae]